MNAARACDIGPCAAMDGHAGTCAEASGWTNDCHADCTIGPLGDHHGTMSYRCMGEHGESLPFPGEPFTTYDMGDHTMYLFPEDDM